MNAQALAARPALPTPPARAAVFIDKDGTLVENLPYNVDPALLRFMPGALDALAALQAAGYVLLLATNQAGLAQGLFTRGQLAALLAVLRRRLQAEAGVLLLDVEVCPHAPGPAGMPACLCRKPAPGMLLRAARRHTLDLQRSWMVGDTLDDVEAGRRAGCSTLLFDSGGETLWRRSPLRQPSASCTHWHDVARQIAGHAQQPTHFEPLPHLQPLGHTQQPAGLQPLGLVHPNPALLAGARALP